MQNYKLGDEVIQNSPKNLFPRKGRVTKVEDNKARNLKNTVLVEYDGGGGDWFEQDGTRVGYADKEYHIRKADSKDSLQARHAYYEKICKKMLALGRVRGFFSVNQREDGIEYNGNSGIVATTKAWNIKIDAEKEGRLRVWSEYGRIVIYKPN